MPREVGETRTPALKTDPPGDAHPPDARGRLRNAVFAALTLGVSLTLSFTAVEWAARYLERRNVDIKLVNTGLAIIEPLPGGSYRLRPNLDLQTQVKGVRVNIRTNSHGMAWREVDEEKPRRVQRIAFLGDSFTFGCWARSYEHGFVGVFERGLNPRRYEALNFGVGGHGLDDAELTLRTRAARFSPDWVFVMLFAGNDFRDTWLGPGKHTIVDGTAQLREDVVRAKVPAHFVDVPAPPAGASPDPSRLRAALKRLAVFRLLLPRLGLDHLALDFEPARRFTSFPFWSQQPAPPIALRARDHALETLARMDHQARELGARLVVVAIPYREQVYSDAWSGPGYDLSYPQVWVQTWARERGVPYFDLLPRLREHVIAANEDLYVEADIHWNERGHELVGEWLRAWFLEELRRVS